MNDEDENIPDGELLGHVQIPASEHPATEAGRRSGFGGCACCEGTWNWRKQFSIPINSREGVFPLCVSCAKRMTVYDIMAEVKLLVGNRSGEESIDHEPSYAYARAALERWDKAGRVDEEAR